MKRNSIPTDGFIMGQGTYNFYRATGQRKIMDSMASGTGLFSIITCDFDEDVLQAVGIRREQLSEMVKFTDTSPLCDETAALSGLKKSGIPVVPTGPDGGLNQIGAGALGDGIMTVSVGTSGAMRLSTVVPQTLPNSFDMALPFTGWLDERRGYIRLLQLCGLGQKLFSGWAIVCGYRKKHSKKAVEDACFPSLFVWGEMPRMG